MQVAHLILPGMFSEAQEGCGESGPSREVTPAFEMCQPLPALMEHNRRKDRRSRNNSSFR